MQSEGDWHCWLRHWCIARGIGAAIALTVPTGLVAQESAPPFPAPGRMVDIGGWRLHLNCTGTGAADAPTVILEAGVGDFSVEWSLVQPAVAQFARVCSYDRAGDGWSDLGPDPRTYRQLAWELHELLVRAKIPPPYVLVAHSFGALVVRAYLNEYPDGVAGIVFVEAGAEDPWRLMANGKVVRSSTLAKGSPVPPVRTTGPLREGDVPPAAMAQITRWVAQAPKTANEPPRDKLPREAQAMRVWALGRWEHLVATRNPVGADELAAMLRSHDGKEFPFGDMPVAVVTRGRPDETGPDAKALEEDHRREHVALAAQSRSGWLVIADQSGHHVQIEEPSVVVRAIRDVVAATDRRQVVFSSPHGDLMGDAYGTGTRGVVLVGHGGYSLKETWAGLAHTLADGGFRVLAFNSSAAAALKAGKETLCLYDEHCMSSEILAAVRYLRNSGVSTVSIVAASAGAGGAEQAAIEAKPGELARLVLLAPMTIGANGRIPGPKLYIVGRRDLGDADKPRLPEIQSQFDRASGPKELIVLDESAHGQRLLATREGDRVARDIVRFLSAP